MEKLISTIEKNSREEIRVELSEFKGHDLLAVRVYTDIDGAEERKPTKKGITINVKLLPDLLKAVTEAERQARQGGLLP